MADAEVGKTKPSLLTGDRAAGQVGLCVARIDLGTGDDGADGSVTRPLILA